MAPTLRPFRWWDIEPVRRMEQDLFPEDPWSVEMFWSELADVPHSRYYVIAEEAGEIAGYKSARATIVNMILDRAPAANVVGGHTALRIAIDELLDTWEALAGGVGRHRC